MNKTMNNEQDKLLREALRRRADRVPTLSDDFQDAVLHRMQRTHPVPPLKGGDGLRHGSLKIWAWVASIAAILVIGFFVFQRETPSPIPPRGEGIVPKVPSMVAETSQSSPSLQGRAGGGSSRGQASGSSVSSSPSPRGGQGKGPRANGASSIAISPSPRGGQGVGVSSTAPTLADLYAAIDQMTNEAIEEADRLMAEALVREYTDDEPS